MRIITIADIRSWEPCYDPARYLAEDWSGTALDLLAREDIQFSDVLWVVAREDVLSPKLLRLFAVWCARQVQHLMTDARSIAAIDVAERFANGIATREELAAAGDAAWDAADAAWAAADAAWAAAGDAAWDAARGAAYAARAAAWAAAYAAAWAAAYAAARDAARAKQRAKLIEMVKAEIETGDVLP